MIGITILKMVVMPVLSITMMILNTAWSLSALTTCRAR